MRISKMPNVVGGNSNSSTSINVYGSASMSLAQNYLCKMDYHVSLSLKTLESDHLREEFKGLEGDLGQNVGPQVRTKWSRRLLRSVPTSSLGIYPDKYFLQMRSLIPNISLIQIRGLGDE